MNSSSDTPSTNEPAPSEVVLPPEAYASRLVDYKTDLANEIGLVMTPWLNECPAMKTDNSYSVIDKELHLLMMIYNLALRLDAATNRITELETDLGHLTICATDDGK